MIGAANNVGLGLGFAILIIVWLVVGVGSLVMCIVALVDIVRRPDWEWRLARQEKVVWILLVILVNILAIPSLIYWFKIRKQLVAVRDAAARGEYGPGHMTYAGWEPGPPVMAQPTWSPAGWYPDPSLPGQLRWFDGMRWTEHVWSQTAP